MKVLDWLAQRRKAIAGYLVPPLFLLGAFLLPGSDGGSAITGQEWIGIVVAGLTGGTVVYAIPNRRKEITSAD